MDNACGMITSIKVSEEKVCVIRSGLSHIFADGARGIKSDRTSLGLAASPTVKTLNDACY